jgi:sugar O-acyltransferase (sialic acid O-acetyltransferase NeuD family)
MNDANGRGVSFDAAIRGAMAVRPGVLIVGCSSHAQVVIDIVESEGRYQVVGLIDSFKPAGTQLRGYEVIGTEQEIPMLFQAGVASFGIVAIGDNWTRARMVARIRELQPDFQFVTAIHPGVHIARDVTVGEGTVIMAGAVVNTGSRIGAFCILNTRSSVDHECTVAEYSSLAPGVVTGGRVIVGQYSAIGIGATVVHEVRIGEHTVVGAGTTVLKDVPDYVVVYGTPARIVRGREAGESYLMPIGGRAQSARPQSIVKAPIVNTSQSITLFAPNDIEWTRYLADTPHDFFHTPEYHQVWARVRGADGALAVYGRPDKFVAWPYLRQPISDVSWAEGQPVYDVTSAYGFSGPLVHGCDNDPAFLRAAWTAIVDVWRSQSIVTVFTRFHPLLGSDTWVQQICRTTDPIGAGGILAQGKTVAIDLTIPETETWNDYKRQLRQSIRRAQKSAVRIVHDPEWQHLHDFKRLYYATMKRNGASAFYYFTADFFNNLRTAAGAHASLMVALYEDKVVSAAMLIEFGGIVNVFLLGSDPAHHSLSAGKLLIHEAHAWARKRGNRYLHLGGGRCSRDCDELFRFKRLFSTGLFPFYTGRWILDQRRHDELLKERQRDARLRGDSIRIADDFFPAYRAPFTHVLSEQLHHQAGD